MKLAYNQRLFILQFVFLLIFILIWVQLFNLQILKSQGLITEAKKQFYQPQIKLRGDIRDRNGELLALDIITYDLYNNADKIEKISKEKIISLAKILNTSTEEIIKNLSQKKNVKIFSGISDSQV